jgi:hypothetical protein
MTRRHLKLAPVERAPENWAPPPGFTPRPRSPEVQREVQAILDAAARRILEQELREAGLD